MIIIDIETGPLPEEELREAFTPPSLDEFAASCDKRWKPETVEAKFREHESTAWPKFVEKAALSPVTGRLLVVGYLSTDTGRICLHGPDSEAEAIDQFWWHLLQCRRSKRLAVGHNIKGFDVPFLIGRSWILGIDAPTWLIDRGRYISGDGIVDTMERWSLVTGQPFAKLGDVAAALGVGEKTGQEEVTGANFHEFWHGGDEKKKLAEAYLLKDLQLTADVAARMGVL